MKKKSQTSKTRWVRRTFHTTPEVSKALIEAANREERPAAWIITQALKQYLGISSNAQK